MLETERVKPTFADGHATYADSLRSLDEATAHWDRQELQRSAGKAWAAALQATNALVLAHTGIEPKPDDDRDTTRQMLRLRRESLELEDMVARYSSISAYLFGLIVSDGVLDPIDDTIREVPDKGMYGVSHRSSPSFFRRRNVTPVKTGAGIQKHFRPVTFSFPVGSWIPAFAGTTGGGAFS